MRIIKIIISLNFVFQSSQINLYLLINSMQKLDYSNSSERSQLKYNCQDSFEKKTQNTLKTPKFFLKKTNQISNQASEFELQDIVLLLSMIIFYFYQRISIIFHNLFLSYIKLFFTEKIQPPWIEKFLLKI